MQAKRENIYPEYFLIGLFLAVGFLAGCSAHARSTAVYMEKAAADASDYQADEFIGTPIIGDYDDDPDLDFVLEVREGDRVFKINIHEDVNESNREVIDRIRRRINEMEDTGSLRVIGYYNSEYRGREKEYGSLDLKCIVFFEDEHGYEEAFFTDAKDSRFYESGDVTIIYAPGHHYRYIYYPRWTSPWWDIDGDGIPNRYDPWPFTYDLWYDYNLNFIPDWYDPYYCGYYPYWDYWSVGFWIDYGWYSPVYYRHRYTARVYYDSYRVYTRIYDNRYVQTSRKSYRLDVKSERRLRSSYANYPRAISAVAGSRLRGYESTPVDRRILSPVSSTTGTLDVKSSAGAISGGGSSPIVFTRNRAVDATTIGAGRNKVASSPRVSYEKRKAISPSSSTRGALRTTGRSRSARSERADQPLSRRRSTPDDRIYSPTRTTRARDITSRSASASASSSTKYKSSRRGRDRSRYSAPADGSRTYSRDRSSSRAASSPSYSGARTSRARSLSRSAPRVSSAPSTRSRTRSAPAARAPSRARSSSPAPAARSSSSSSRSRSSEARSSSSSTNRRRRN